jgi:glycosyltransferase involved in cell wall biosynthesis
MGNGPQSEGMKIAFLNDRAHEYAVGGANALGGLERNIWFHSRALAAAGWTVKIGVRSSLRDEERQVIEGVEYVGVGHGQVLAAWYRFLAAERPDWLYWGGASHLLGPLVEVAKLAGVRTVFASALDEDVEPRRAAFRRSRLWPLYAWGLRRADRIFVQHTGQLMRLHPRLRDKACVLPKVCPLSPNMKVHAQRQKYVAWVATLRRHKRPDILVDIARRVPDVKFIVCGGPTDYLTTADYGMQMVDALTKLANVAYRGRVSSEEANQVIADAALLLCTSDIEGFPNTFTQAWANGTPIVTLNVDPDNLIEKKGLGAVSRTVDGAISDITTLLASVDRREEIAARAKQHISDNHNPAAVVRIFDGALAVPN